MIFGVDYYPEQWDEKLWAHDLDRMKSMGVSLVRIMEFAWSILEPQKGKYDFSLFDRFIDLAEEKEMNLVLGTPTATIPYWLYKKDTAMMQRSIMGVDKIFGGRRQVCFNNKTFRRAARNITSRVVKRYSDRNIIDGWQIDNEVGHEGSDVCTCDNCQKQWHLWLKKKYNTIKSLNDQWGTQFWSTRYNSFNEVPIHLKNQTISQNPSLILDYYRFSSETIVAYVHEQTEIVRKIIPQNQWISTNLYPPPMSNSIDMDDLFSAMDFPGYDNYPVWGDQDEPFPYYFNAFILAYIRGLRPEGNFTIFEQICGIQGHVVLGHLPPLGQIAAWTNQAIAHGADKIIYFRWRTAAVAQEQLCNGILDPDNSHTPLYEALQKNIEQNKKDFDSFASIPFKAEACLVYDKDNARLLKDQYLSKGIHMAVHDFVQAGYDAEMARNYAPFSLFNINADVKTVKGIMEKGLDQYKVISLPLYQMSDPEFVEELRRWVSAGGILILGWRSGTKDLNNQTSSTEFPGPFQDLAGLKVKRYESLNEDKVKIRVGIFSTTGEVWADLLEPTEASVLGRYSDKKKHYRGTPCFTENSFGAGKVYYIGTSPGALGTVLMYRKIFKKSSCSPKFYGMGLEVLKRQDLNGGEILVAVNHTPKTRFLKGKFVKPYGFRIIKR